MFGKKGKIEELEKKCDELEQECGDLKDNDADLMHELIKKAEDQINEIKSKKLDTKVENYSCISISQMEKICELLNQYGGEINVSTGINYSMYLGPSEQTKRYKIHAGEHECRVNNGTYALKIDLTDTVNFCDIREIIVYKYAVDEEAQKLSIEACKVFADDMKSTEPKEGEE